MASGALDEELWVEALKVWRSVVPLVTTLASVAFGVVLGLQFFRVLMDPSLARSAGALADNGSVNWGRYVLLAGFVAAAVGFLVFVWLTTWLLGLLRRRPPTTRAAVTAIVIIALRWSLLEVGKILALSLAVGTLLFVGTLLPPARL
jgi:hypothetical protein